MGHVRCFCATAVRVLGQTCSLLGRLFIVKRPIQRNRRLVLLKFGIAPPQDSTVESRKMPVFLHHEGSMLKQSFPQGDSIFKPEPKWFAWSRVACLAIFAMGLIISLCIMGVRFASVLNPLARYDISSGGESIHIYGAYKVAIGAPLYEDPCTAWFSACTVFSA